MAHNTGVGRVVLEAKWPQKIWKGRQNLVTKTWNETSVDSDVGLQWFCFTFFCDWPRKHLHRSNIKLKTNTNRTTSSPLRSSVEFSVTEIFKQQF